MLFQSLGSKHPMPRHYGDAAAEYVALEQGVALTDRSAVGKLRLRGTDALDLLNRLSTNNVDALAPGEGAPTVLTTGKGRVVDLLLVTASHDHILCLTSPGRQQAVVEWLDFYTFSEDVEVEDISETHALLGLTGPGAPQVLLAFGAPIGALPRFHSRDTTLGAVPALVWRTLSSGTETYELVLPREKAGRLREALVAAGATPVGEEAWEAFRTVHGVPVFGAEFGEEANPLESRLRGAISFNKGCYVGQEVVARLNTYHRVQRQLMAGRLSGPARPGDTLLAESQRAGHLTSVARMPTDGTYVALALVRQEMATAGTTLTTAEGPTTVTLSEPAYALATEPVEV